MSRDNKVMLKCNYCTESSSSGECVYSMLPGDRETHCKKAMRNMYKSQLIMQCKGKFDLFLSISFCALGACALGILLLSIALVILACTGGI